jgi:hypothetical protein
MAFMSSMLSSLPGRWPSIGQTASSSVVRIVRTVVHVNEDGTIISQGADSSVTDEGNQITQCRGSVVRNYQLKRIAAKGLAISLNG